MDRARSNGMRYRLSPVDFLQDCLRRCLADECVHLELLHVQHQLPRRQFGECLRYGIHSELRRRKHHLADSDRHGGARMQLRLRDDGDRQWAHSDHRQLAGHRARRSRRECLTQRPGWIDQYICARKFHWSRQPEQLGSTAGLTDRSGVVELRHRERVRQRRLPNLSESRTLRVCDFLGRDRVLERGAVMAEAVRLPENVLAKVAAERRGLPRRQVAVSEACPGQPPIWYIERSWVERPSSR